MPDFLFINIYLNLIMTEDEIKRHEEWYRYYFGYSHLTPERRCKRGVLTEESKY